MANPSRGTTRQGSRRSFFVRALSGAAGLWVAGAGGAAALGALLASCLPVAKYGGPPPDRGTPPDAAPSREEPIEPACEYGGPPDEPEAEDPTPEPATKYGGPRPQPDYGGAWER